ncbi:MAG: hypothetical protein CMJ78_07275 [Planctomycetaceae bacterium]|nr:hypothetical protein [Planctomycetaceae bacterium]
MNWKYKALLQRVLAATPTGDSIYYQIQRSMGGLKDFRIEQKLQQALRLLRGLAEGGGTLFDRRAIEIGTGWTPIIPIMYWLYGQAACATYDLRKLLKPELLKSTCRQMIESQALLAQAPFAVLPERMAELQKMVAQDWTVTDMLAAMKITYHAPCDATKNAGIPDKSVDLVYSNTVMEHVTPTAAEALLRESHRMLSPGGTILHLIDMSDHFSHGDNSITAINFLRYDDKCFARYNSKFMFQNRWRASKWHQLVEDHGFEIVVWESCLDQRSKEHLSNLTLAPEFADLEEDDLCTTSVVVLGKLAQDQAEH